MSNSNLHDDIAYMKSLAEDGSRPVVNGSPLFWAGLFFSMASLAQYGFEAGILPLGNPWYQVAVWASAGVAFGLSFFLPLGGTRASGHPAGRAVNSVWSAIGLAIAALGFCMTAAGVRLHSVEAMTALIAPAILILYGIGWWVAAVVSCQGWLKLICAGCFLAAPAIAYLATLPEQMLAYAGCLVLFAMLPGLILIRSAKG
ncbi:MULTISPECIES: hypothetical protein [Asticcacaulis]|uniref:hypothetical protein n=1 Tax=Asticcacaulis TaxID=76890 RepID=UPI001AE746EF|nr:MULTISPECIES: hypothetical protein [Asticcacaulis]MBP2159239.1 hypothetical protein [Asticcacaulis solisilvae]MDR6800284.1 hypothetical protein [Asticcacaulis sp. BE141]